MTAILLEPTPQRDIKWADGLRGVAAIFVVTSHLTLGFAQHLVNPAPTKGASLKWYNYPIIRIFAEGPVWVNFFFILTGFVNAMGPIKRARAGNVEGSLAGLASSTFRRTSRLVLPCTIATVISWFICQLQGYLIGRMIQSEWMRNTSSPPGDNIFEAIGQLFTELWRTWAESDNLYDRNQWTMPFFLKASFMLFVALLATVKAVPRYRMLIFFGLYLYSWFTKDTMIGLLIYGGALLAELSLYSPITSFSNNRSIPARAFSGGLLILGLVLCSFTKENPDWAKWTASLNNVGYRLFPREAFPGSFWPSIGCQVVTLAIILSAPVQRILSHRILLWLGQASLPIYLIHGPLIRSFLNWMLYAGVKPDELPDPDKEGDFYYLLPLAPTWRYFVVIPIFWVALMSLAHLWVLKVEPWCAMITKKSEDVICGKGSSARQEIAPSLLPMAQTEQRLIL